MNILILGGNGFIGSHLIDVLLDQGHKIRVIDQYPEKYRSPIPGVDYRFFNINDYVSLYESMIGIDIIYHLASISSPGVSNINPIEEINKNLISSVQLFELMRKIGLKRIVFLSSGGAVYGNSNNLPVREDHELNPISSYGITKLTIEKYLFMYQELYGLQPIIIRPSNPYGPRQGHFSTQGVIATFLRKTLQNEKIQVWGDGNATKDFIFIKDLAEFCILAGISSKTGIYNAGSGIGNSIKEIIGLIEKTTQKSINIEYINKKETDVEKIYLDISKAKDTFGWCPKISLVDGVTIFAQWMAANLMPGTDNNFK